VPLNATFFLVQIANDLLVFLHDLGFVYGTAIIVLTFIVRALILPLSVRQIRGMREMSAISPHIKEIRERYKDDPQRMQREQMRLFQEHGINPLASCLPLLLQFPVFITLFYLLRSNDFQDEVREAGEESWLFVNDLTQSADGGELAVLLALYIGTSLIAGLISTSRSATTQQRLIALGLPLAFGPIMVIYNFPAGLWIYWIATNLWTVGQQAVVQIFFPPPPQPTPEEVRATKPPPPPPRKRKRRR
jgi:YidC/Oxa1 family membrane protein insertase